MVSSQSRNATLPTKSNWNWSTWKSTNLSNRRFWPSAPRIEVSTQTGQGIAEVRQALIDTARSSPMRPNSDPRFRLPIDRAFSATGQGAVVTGTVWRGTARVGDMLQLLPEAAPVRVRRLQSQGVDVEQVSAGERAAINLARHQELDHSPWR